MKSTLRADPTEKFQIGNLPALMRFRQFRGRK